MTLKNTQMELGVWSGEMYSVYHSVMSDSLRSHRLSPTTLLCPWNSSDKNTGVGRRSLGGLLDSGIEPGSPALQTDSLLSEPPRKPQNTWACKELISTDV